MSTIDKILLENKLEKLIKYKQYNEQCYAGGGKLSSRDLANSLDSDRAYRIGYLEGQVEGFCLALELISVEEDV